jgi:hypothetical protein
MPHGLPPPAIDALLRGIAGAADSDVQFWETNIMNQSVPPLEPQDPKPPTKLYDDGIASSLQPKASWLKRALLALVLVTLAAAAVIFTPRASAASLTDFFENAILNHLFRGTAYTAPATVYVSLHTTACTDATPGTEVTGGAYARAAVAAGAGSWTAPSAGNGTIANANTISFPTPSAGWGLVTHFQLFDAATAGNALVCQALTTSKTINSGDTVSFAAGSLTIQIDN